MGFTLAISKEIITRKRLLDYEGISYYAAPIEFMFLTKSVEYITALKNGNIHEFKKTKHYEDICRMSTIIDWPFAKTLLQSIRIKWAGIYPPEFIQKKINPYRILEIDKLKRLIPT